MVHEKIKEEDKALRFEYRAREVPKNVKEKKTEEKERQEMDMMKIREEKVPTIRHSHPGRPPPSAL